nr:MAG TPA: hypothetical protein [Caudoviricetes sp.]
MSPLKVSLNPCNIKALRERRQETSNLVSKIKK